MPVIRIHLRYIQQIPAHKNSKTTEIYTPASTKNFSAIKNPIADLLPEDGGK